MVDHSRCNNLQHNNPTLQVVEVQKQLPASRPDDHTAGNIMIIMCGIHEPYFTGKKSYKSIAYDHKFEIDDFSK